MHWGSAFTGSPAECLELPEGPVALLGILKHAADSTVGKNCLWTTFIDSRVSLESPLPHHEICGFGARLMAQWIKLWSA